MGNKPIAAVTGHNSYQFGDITRTILGIPRPPSPEPETKPQRSAAIPFPGFSVVFPRPGTVLSEAWAELGIIALLTFEIVVAVSGGASSAPHSGLVAASVAASATSPRRFMPTDVDSASGSSTGSLSSFFAALVTLSPCVPRRECPTQELTPPPPPPCGTASSTVLTRSQRCVSPAA